MTNAEMYTALTDQSGEFALSTDEDSFLWSLEGRMSDTLTDKEEAHLIGMYEKHIMCQTMDPE